MFGYLRFILAFMVLVSHVGVRVAGLNPGVIAVVVFYLLAGYVVAGLWQEVIPPGPGKLFRFFRDRILRIMPLYLYVCLLTLAFLALTGYGNPEFDFFRLTGNFLVIPLNYYMVLDTTVLADPAWCLIPPAWSLGAELQAYILLPWALSEKWVKYLLAGLSFMVYMLANFSVLHPDYFGYRLIAGVFFIFLAGASIRLCRNDRTRKKFDFWFPRGLWFVIAMLGMVFMKYGLFSPAYTKETFIGLLAGMPLVVAGAGTKIRLPLNRLLGGLSYGIFLSHFLVVWWLDYTGLVGEGSWAYISAVTLGSLVIAWIGVWLVERPVAKVRCFNGRRMVGR